jgi:hypothetical protein
VPVADRRQQEDRQRRGRVLDPEVAIGKLAVDYLVAIPLVDRDVDDLVALVEAAVEQRPSGAEGGERDEPGGEGRPALSR